MLNDELRHQRGPLAGAAGARDEPVQHRPRALKSRRVHQHVLRLAVDHEGMRARLPGGPRRCADGNTLVLGKRCNDRALAFVGMAHDGKGRNHAASALAAT